MPKQNSGLRGFVIPTDECTETRKEERGPDKNNIKKWSSW